MILKRLVEPLFDKEFTHCLHSIDSEVDSSEYPTTR